jgi:hypothetical protein
MMVAWILSVFLCMKGLRRYVPLSVLLTVSVVMELIVAWFYINDYEFIWVYHVYAIFDYALYCIFFMQLASPKMKKLIKISILIFAMISLSISYFYYHFKTFPGAVINTEGVFLCIICMYALLNLDIHLFDTIYKHPDFWISLGLLVFFAGTFFSNGLYTYMREIDAVRAKKLFDIINKPFNLIQYSCFIIGFICAIPRRSTLRLF